MQILKKIKTHQHKFVLGIVAAAIVSCSLQTPNAKKNTDSIWPQAQSPKVGSKSDQQVVSEILAKMTLEEKVGQILQAEIQTITPAQAKEYNIGSILNGGGSTPNRHVEADAKEWAEFADRYFYASSDKSDGGVGIPIVWGTDAVHGHNNVIGATIFPHNIGLGATGNTDLIKKIGEATAKEVRATGIAWVFAPTVAVVQNDRWGRTYESYSEDPTVVAKMAKNMVLGLQGEPGTNSFLDEEHVLATAKHYLGDGGTSSGDDQGDTKISEQELVDIHSPGYVTAINAGVQSIMASFNSWNGEKMHGNKYLLTDKLRGDLGFDGMVVGDWSGHGQLTDCTSDSCPASINAGLDMFMVPYDWKSMYGKTLQEVKEGKISPERLDEAVTRILMMKQRAGLLTTTLAPSQRKLGGQQAMIGHPEHRAIARQAVRESLVLLKNNHHILPIKPNQHVLVTGDAADNIGKQSGGWSTAWQGVNNKNELFPGATSIYSGLKTAINKAGGSAEYSINGSYQQKPDVAIVVFGENPYAEGSGDINTLEFEAGNKQSLDLLTKLKAQNIPVVSVFISGRPLWVNPELNASDAFIAAWLPGSEGQGVADVLVAKSDGKANYDFKGRLTFSWPKLPTQAELNFGDADYDPLFKLGYGLTYRDDTQLAELKTNVAGLMSSEPQDLVFFNGRPLQPWYILFKDYKNEQIMSGPFADLPGTIKLTTSDKDVQEDAVTVEYKDSWISSVEIKGGTLDLSPYMDKGTLEFDINLESINHSALDIKVGHSHFDTRVRLREWAQAREGKGWQHIAIPMQCFVKENIDFSAVEKPFELVTGGQGKYSLANVRFVIKGSPNFACPNAENITTTPAVLNEYWSVDWWLPRHEEKLAQVAKGGIDWVMIGDSITHNWEKSGKEVLAKYFPTLNVLNLGYGGDRTENVIWRLQHGELDKVNPKFISIMIGTNNTGHRMDKPEYIANGVAKIIDIVKHKAPNATVLLQAIFPRSENQHDGLRINNKRTNELLEQLAKQKNVLFANFNPDFLEADGTLSKEIMPDLLHPEDQGYEIWAEKLAPYVNKYVK
jgi:beta-glucosidase